MSNRQMINVSTIGGTGKMFTTGNQTVDAIGQMHLEGNIIPHQWFEYMRFDNGKPDLTAIIILSEIVYWYRPVYQKDEISGQLLGIKKRFKADMLQRSYESFSEQFGVTKRQAKDAIVRLEKLNFIKRHFRTIEANSTKLSNVLFVELLHENVIAMTFKRHRGDITTSEVTHSNVTPLTVKRQTNTEITTEITTNKNVELIIEYLNVKASKNFKASTAATRKFINGRLLEGYTFEDFKRVIDVKATQWLNNPDMNVYLRPSTLFAPKNFENYLNENIKPKQVSGAGPISSMPQQPILNFEDGE